jgi:hypothetical protein
MFCFGLDPGPDSYLDPDCAKLLDTDRPPWEMNTINICIFRKVGYKIA